MTEKVKTLVDFFDKNRQYVPGCGIYNTRNIAGDRMQTIYDEPADGVTVDICWDYDYIEIFGLTKDEFRDASEQIEAMYVDPWAHEYDDDEEDND